MSEWLRQETDPQDLAYRESLKPFVVLVICAAAAAAMVYLMSIGGDIGTPRVGGASGYMGHDN